MVRFLRVAKLQVFITNEKFTGYTTSFEINGLRVAFSITKSCGWSTNVGIIKVWNLNSDTRNTIAQYGDQIVLYAGYEKDGGEQIIYIGQTTAVSHAFEQPEIVTTLECGDGDKFLNQKKNSYSFSAGTPARQVLAAIAADIGIDIGGFVTSNNLAYPLGFKFVGMAKEALEKACGYLSLQYTVQNNKLYILEMQNPRSSFVYEINENTGMHGIPERFIYRRQLPYLATQAPTDGYKVNVSLITSISPGDRVMLSSSRLGIDNVPCMVQTVRHLGDTFGPEWVSNLELTRVPA